jgi:hypothetical protein
MFHSCQLSSEQAAMFQLAKTLHVLAVGLWFGMAVIFSLPVALSLFATFERLTEDEQRPAWLPLPDLYDKDPRAWSSPPSGIAKPPFETVSDVRKEQGSRAAGAAVGPMFDWYFLLQGACAVVALATALPWSRAEPGVRAHRLRVIVLMLAFLTVLVGWPLERKVSELRGPRNEATDALLQAAPDIPESVYREAVEARQAFGMWHGFSTTLNLGTIALVTVAMALAARLPNGRMKAEG